MSESNEKADATGQLRTAFHENRKLLGALIRRLREILRSLNITEWDETLQRLEERVLADVFKLLVVGELARGKSTFINALLRQDVLFSSALPSEIINEVKWDETPKAFWHSGNSPDQSSKEIKVEDIQSFAINGHSEAAGDGLKRVELYWPLELCRNRVEIIELPYLSGGEGQRQVILDYLAHADAVLLVLSCDVLGSKSETDFIDDVLVPSGHTDVFFICNRLDSVRPDQRESLKEYAISHLSPRTSGGSARVFFISALEALEGSLNDDPLRFEKSGVAELELALKKLLTEDQGRVKMQRAAILLKAALRRARNVLDEKKVPSGEPKEQSSPPESIVKQEERPAELQERLRQLEETRRRVVSTISRFAERTRDFIKDVTLNFGLETAGKIEGWVESYRVDLSSRVMSAVFPEEARKTVAETLSFVERKAERESSDWQANTLAPLLAEHMARLQQELDEDAQSFTQQLVELHGETSKNAGSIMALDPRVLGIEALKESTPIIRFSFADEYQTDAPVATLGYSDVLIILLTEIVLAGLILRFVGFEPLILVPVLVLGGLLVGYIMVEAAHKKSRRQVIQYCVKAFRSVNPAATDRLTSFITDKLDEGRVSLDQKLAQEIQYARQQGRSTMMEKRSPTVENKAGDAAVVALTAELEEINKELNDIITRVSLDRQGNNSA